MTAADNRLTFKNRLFLNLFDNSVFGTKNNILTVGDSRSSLNSDKSIDDTHFLHLFELVMDLTKPKHHIDLDFLAISEMQKISFPRETYSLYDVIKNGDALYLLLVPKEGDKNYCLSQLKIRKGEVPELEFSQENPLFVSDVSSANGFLGMTDHDQNGYLIRVKSEDGTLVIQKNSLKGKIQQEEYKWIGETTFIESENDFGIKNGIIAVRDVNLGYKDSFLIRTIAEENQGLISDQKLTIYGIFKNNIDTSSPAHRTGQIEALGAADGKTKILSTGTLIDSILFEIREKTASGVRNDSVNQSMPNMEVFFRRTSDPFLVIYGDKLLDKMDSNKRVKLSIGISDSETTSLTVEADFYLVTDPYDKVEI